MTLPAAFFQEFRDADREQQALLLARLLHALGIVARDTFRPGSTDVDDPVRLRRISELSHRIATKQVQILVGWKDGMPDGTFLQFLAVALDEVEVHPDTLDRLLSPG